jgi:hypothetical protein
VKIVLCYMPHDHKYKALVKGNIINWPEGIPPELKDAQEHAVDVIIPPSQEELLARSKKAAAILEELSKLDPFRGIEDPSEWQREIRKDRPLPGRE